MSAGNTSRTQRKQPRDHGDPRQPWGSKVFDRKTVPDDEHLRQTLRWLQDITVKLQQILDAEGMPPDELARHSGVAVRTLRAILRGEVWPDYEKLSRIMAAAGMNVDVDAHLDQRPLLQPSADRQGSYRRGRRRPSTRDLSSPAAPVPDAVKQGKDEGNPGGDTG